MNVANAARIRGRANARQADATDFFIWRRLCKFLRCSRKEHAKAGPAEPNAVYDGLSPEELLLNSSVADLRFHLTA